jgi:hypothetical protein
LHSLQSFAAPFDAVCESSEEPILLPLAEGLPHFCILYKFFRPLAFAASKIFSHMLKDFGWQNLFVPRLTNFGEQNFYFARSAKARVADPPKAASGAKIRVLRFLTLN